MKNIIIAAMLTFPAILAYGPVNAADQKPTPEVTCISRNHAKPGFVCSDGTRISQLGEVEIEEKGKAPNFTVIHKLLKVSTQIGLQQCEGGRYTTCLNKPWDDIDFVSIDNEADCIIKGRIMAMEKLLRASRQGFTPSVTWTCM